MPCDGGPSRYEEQVLHGQETKALKARIRELEALLCELCTAWVATFGRGKTHALPASVQAWWRQHQARDRKRARDAKAAAARSERARQVAITRLERQRTQIDAELKTLRAGKVPV